MLKVLPYVLPLFPYTEVTPRLWFIVGLGGHWDNSVAGLGSSLIPLNLSDGKKYNLKGDGEFTYTGYFKASESFKLVRDYTSATPWNEFWGMSGSVLKHNSGDNIAVTADGYYTLTLNSIDNTLTIVAAAAPANNYTSMGMMGEFNGWSTDIPMAASLSTNNHVWYTTYTFANDYTPNGGCKFRANGTWDVGWGGNSFPYGIGTSVSGANILFKAGTYVIIFNDLDASKSTTGTYYFIKK
jgi:starch-binding outer membrane protein SusE/F